MAESQSASKFYSWTMLGTVFVLFFAVWNFISGFTLFNYSLNVRRVALYRNVNVFNMRQKNNYLAATSKDHPRSLFAKLSGSSATTAAMNRRLIHVKQYLGCFGENANINDKTAVELTAQEITNLVMPEGKSVCTCIDQHVYSILSGARRTNISTAIGAANYPIDKTHFDICDDSGGEIDCLNKLREYHQIIISDCTMNGVPQKVQSYEGVFDVHTHIFVSLLLLVLSIWCAYTADNSQKSYGIFNYLPNWSKSLQSFCFVALGVWSLVITAVNNGNFTDKQFLSFRSDATKFTNYCEFGYTLSFYIIVAGVVHLISGNNYILEKISIFSSNTEIYGIVSEVTQVVFCDLPKIIGFAVLGCSLVLAYGISNVEHLYYTLVVISVIGFLQHLSNVLRIVYQNIGIRLDSNLISKLQTNAGTNDSEDMNYSNMKSLLQYIVMGRIYIFVLVWVLGLNLFVNSPAAIPISHLQNYNSSNFMYFVLFFLLTSMSYDIIYEIMPGVFVHKYSNTHYRSKILIVYLLWFTITQFVFEMIQYNGDQRHKITNLVPVK